VAQRNSVSRDHREPSWARVAVLCHGIRTSFRDVARAGEPDEGHGRNIEVGARLDNPIFAQQVTAHLSALVQARKDSVDESVTGLFGSPFVPRKS